MLSNDSFQEFHGEHPWLFEQGRLIGAMPVPGIGWIFSARRSHGTGAEKQRSADTDTKGPATTRSPGRDRTGRHPRGGRARGAHRSPDRGPCRDGRASAVSPQAVNDPMTFISFIAEHHLGSELEGEVESFTSHGAVVRFGDVRCYVPLSPWPRRPRATERPRASSPRVSAERSSIDRLRPVSARGDRAPASPVSPLCPDDRARRPLQAEVRMARPDPGELHPGGLHPDGLDPGAEPFLRRVPPRSPRRRRRATTACGRICR